MTVQVPPVAATADANELGGPEDGIALCLSGGGYRAMIFHLGALIRLNEAGLLPRLARVSSVSGGSIVAAVLGLKWKELSFGADGEASNFGIVTAAVRAMASTNVDAGAILGGILLPGTISDRVAAVYDRVLFGGARLSDLPDDAAGEGPRFVINATNVQNAALWRFSRPYMGDWRSGLVRNPQVRLADAVAASSAFPPVLSPSELVVRQPFEGGADPVGAGFDGKVVLSDGGVYDNLGLETAYKRYRTLLVSDGGQKIAPESAPAHDWPRHAIRVLNIVDDQVRNLRKRQLIEDYRRGEHAGCYWGIRTDVRDYNLPLDPLGCAARDPSALAAIPTRLQAMPADEQERLANWGYAVSDAALRRHLASDQQASRGATIGTPRGFPFHGGY
jgi:NTE family protein